MNFFKNADVAKEYNVSEVTVGKWIENAVNGKNNLQLILINSKLKVRDNPHNRAEMHRLVNVGLRHRNNLSHKKVEVDNMFYDLFNIEEQIEIIHDLKYHHTVNLKFYYRYKGATFWNENYLHGSSSIPQEVDSLIKNSMHNILACIKTEKVNIIDIGCGNGYPAKNFINNLQVDKYISVDISKEMIDLCINNINKWYPHLETKSYLKDIEHGHFGQVLFDNKQKDNSNVILLLGSTICNSDDHLGILKNLTIGMNHEDLLLISVSLDTMDNRSVLNYNKPINDVEWAWIPTMLGIDVDKCTTNLFYNAENNCKEKILSLDKDYTLSVNLNGREEEIYLNKGTKINRWKHYLLSIPQFVNDLNACGLDIQFLSKSNSNILVGVQLKTK